MSVYQREWTLADISMVTMAAKIMEERQVWTLSLGGAHEVPEVFCSMDSLESVLKETGARVKVQRHGGGESWKAIAEYGGVEFFALYSARELRRIGYEVTYFEPQRVEPMTVAVVP